VFRLNNPKFYTYSKRYGYFNEIIDYYIANTYYTIDELVSIVNDYPTQNLFKKSKKDRIYYKYMLQNDIYYKVINQIPHFNRKWTKEEILEEALKYKTRVKFQQNSGAAYSHAIRYGHLKEACAHMDVLGNLYKRKIYEIRFNNINTVYVGLTCNIKRRRTNHISKSSNKGVRGLIASGEKYTWYTHPNFRDPKNAMDYEDEIIEKRRNEGWTILNIAKGGALGTAIPKMNNKWTYDSVKRLALTYSTLKDFRRDYQAAYVFACKNKFNSEFFSHMVKRNRRDNFTKREIIKAVRSVDTSAELDASIYQYLIRNGVLEKYFKK